MSDQAFQGALTELTAATQQAPAETAAEVPAQVELYELPTGDGNTIKIPLNHELPLKHNGQIQNVPLEKLFNVYRQSSHLNQKTNELKTLKQQLEQERGDMDSYRSMREKYEQIQKWSEENPQQWERLREMWEQREQLFANPEYGQAQTGNVDPRMAYEFKSLRGELESMKQVLDQYKAREQEIQDRQDIESVEKEIAEFQKSYEHVDLGEKDLDGLSLKARIMKHGIDNGYPDFRSAALTFPGLLERLVDTANRQGRTEAAKQIKSDTRAGIVGRGAAPSGQQPLDPRKLNEEQVMDLARAELNQRLRG